MSNRIPSKSFIMKSRGIVITICLLMLTGGYCLWPKNGVATIVGMPPKIKYVSEVSWDEVEYLGFVEREIVFENQGGKKLVVSELRSSCECSGLLEKTQTSGEPHINQEFVVSPGESVSRIVRMQARSENGNAWVSKIDFKTNDPTHETGSILVRIKNVTGGVVCVPSTLNFGNLELGGKRTLDFQVVDASKTPRSVKFIETSDNNIQVKILDARPLAMQKGDITVAHSICRAQLILNPKLLGSLDALCYVYLADGIRYPDAFHISANVISGYESSPRTIALPFRSGSGYVYDTLLSIRRVDQQSFHIEVLKKPNWLEVKNSSQENNAINLLVKYVQANNTRKSTKDSLVLRCSQGNMTYDLTVPLIIMEN